MSSGIGTAWIIAGWGAAIVFDFLSGANYKLIPDNLILILTEIEGNAQPNFILIDAEQFQNIKWIRIKCADFDKEEIGNIY